MATVSTILRTDKIKKSGEAPIHFLVIKNRKKTKIASGLFVDPKYWDENHQRIKPNATNSARLNAFLKNKLSELQDKIVEEENNTKSLTAAQLKRRIFGVKPTDFFSFADEANENYLRNGQASTYKKNKYIIRKLKDFVEKSSLDFQDITPEFLRNYELYLRNKQNNTTNTIHKDFRHIRKLFNDAFRADIIEYHHNPFNKYKLKLEKTQRDYLSELELSRVEELKIEEGTKMDLHRDMFVFSSYVGGLRVSDILLLKRSHFDGSHINFKIQKTGSQLSLKLPEKALAILEKYKIKQLGNGSFIFPMLNEEFDNLTPTLKLNKLSSSTAYINKNLKIIARKAEIEKNLSFHISRHTWATRALRKGISIDKVSKLMGHAQIRETQIYAKIVSEELDKAMDVFND